MGRGLGLVIGGGAWLLSACGTSGGMQPPSSPSSEAAGPTASSSRPEPPPSAETSEPQLACEPASDSFEERAIVAELEALQLLLRHRCFDEAVHAAAAFLVAYPDDDLAVRAAELLVDALALAWQTGPDRDDARERLIEWSERMPTLPVWRHPEADGLRQMLPTLRVGALVSRAWAARDADPPDYEACARDYDAALEPNIGQRIDQLLAGAADCLERAGDQAGASARREELLRRVPESELADEIRERLGHP